MNPEQQLAMLLQPALIRLIDQLRQQLTEASWTWSYDTVEIWPDEVPEQVRSQYAEMMQALDMASGDDALAIQDVLETLPQPIPLYRLDVIYNEAELAINMWELCYQICFEGYTPNLFTMSIDAPTLQGNKIDRQLLDDGEQIDWTALNQKAKVVVTELMETVQSGIKP